MLHFELTEINSEAAVQGLAKLSLGTQIESCLENYPRRKEIFERFRGKQIWLSFFEYFGNESALKIKKKKVTDKKFLSAAYRLFDLLLASENWGKTKIHPFCPHDRYLAKILAEAWFMKGLFTIRHFLKQAVRFHSSRLMNCCFEK